MAGTEDFALVFPSRDYSYRQMRASRGNMSSSGWASSPGFCRGEAPVVIASAQAASSRTVQPEALRQATFKVSTDPAVNEAGDMQALVARLAMAGYARRPQVDG